MIVVLLAIPSEKAEEQQEKVQQPESNTIFSLFEKKPKIPSGVTISGISVGNMTRETAEKRLQKELPAENVSKDMVLYVMDQECILSPEDTGIHWDITGAVDAAFLGEQTEITANLLFDRSSVISKVETFFATLGGIYAPSTCWLEGEIPDLVMKDTPCQSLVIRKGTAGYVVDLIDICDKIMEGYRTGMSQILIDDLGDPKEPAQFDLHLAYQQVSISPVDPEIDKDTLEVIPGRDGYDFDVNKAQRLYEKAKPGDTVRIPMKYAPPELSEEDAWFKDTLGYCKTPYTDNEDRNENLRLACSKLNEVILQPGETLSYNLTLGQRTRDAGYKFAPAYSGTELVNEIGGGICQVSSTLYLSSLFAELNIVERKNHGFPANYIPLGLDATVNWGTTDLKIRNDYDLPVKILAEATDGYVKVRIMGVERRDYYVKMEYRVDDHPSYAAAYRCRYDRETDEEIFRALDHTSIYLEDVWCWPGYAEGANDEETSESA